MRLTNRSICMYCFIKICFLTNSKITEYFVYQPKRRDRENDEGSHYWRRGSRLGSGA